MNSSICKTCNTTFLYYKSTNTGRFCSRSCSATFNNKIRQRVSKVKRKAHCLKCNKQFLFNPKLSRGYYCSLQCSKSNIVNKNKTYKKFLEGILTYRGTLRKLILEKQGHVCAICKNTEWNNQPIPLWLDHIDGNASNNFPSNLRLICLNCDALGNTFGSRNKGKGRRSLGLKPWA